jgi:hypothetical protein
MTTTATKPVTAAPSGPRVRPALAASGILAVIVATIVVLGWLVWPTPPGPITLHTGTPLYAVTATIDNPRMGTTAVEIDLTKRAAGPDRPATVRIQAVMPLMGHATPSVLAAPVGGGRYRAGGVELMMTGPWELLVSIESGTAVDHLTLPLAVRG